MRSVLYVACLCVIAGSFFMPSVSAQSQLFNAAASVPDSDSELLKVIVISRHGIRAPLQSSAELEQYSTGIWPAWPVPPGQLTRHGSQTMQALGRFYRDYYKVDGLFAGSDCERLQGSFAWSDTDQRDIDTAQSFFQGVAPNCTFTVHTVPKGQVDPYQHPTKAHLGHPDRELAVAAVQGRIGANADAVLTANLPAFKTLDRVLRGCVAPPCTAGKRPVAPLYAMPATIQSADDDDHLILESRGPFGLASTLSEIMQLEYAEGLPMSQVGFGRLSHSDLTQILSLHSLFFDLANETPYIAQVQASNLMHLITGAFERATSHESPAVLSPLASGSDPARFVFIAAHDTNIASIAGFLRAEWYVEGGQKTPTFPGGALVFELRRRRADGSLWVRTKYISETLDQLRRNADLTLRHSPAIAPVFITGCSLGSVGYDCPWPVFRDAVKAKLLPEFITP